MKMGRNHSFCTEAQCLEADFIFPGLTTSLKHNKPTIVPSTFAIRSLISVALYNVNNWLISMASDKPKPSSAAFFIWLYVLLMTGHRNPNGIKQNIFSMNSKPIPFTNGIQLILG